VLSPVSGSAGLSSSVFFVLLRARATYAGYNQNDRDEKFEFQWP
jgi:hypothetical protein